MKKVLLDYEVNERTLALIPAAAMDYGTIVLEKGCKLYVRTRPYEIINKCTLIGGSDCHGRRSFILYRTGLKNKLPMPVNPARDIYAFPTQSPKKFHCYWIFYHHVDRIKLQRKPSTYKSIIIFKNGERLSLSESCFVLEKQMYRTWMIKRAMEDRKIEKNLFVSDEKPDNDNLIH